MTAADHATAVQLLRAAAADHLTHLHPDERDELVERITGAIDRCARKRAAAELREAAAEIDQEGDAHSLMEYDELAEGRWRSARDLRDRADALDSQ